MNSHPSGLFSVQLDESAVVAKLTQLHVYVKHADSCFIKIEFLFCSHLEAAKIARDI
jgi:hypothetical protein